MPSAKYPPGTEVNGRYVLGAKLGSDGQVYKAYDRHLDTEVAFKMLEPVAGVAVSWDEAQRLEELRSRFLIRVINADVIANSDIRYIVTPLVSGGDLEGIAQNTGLSVQTAVRYTQQICSGIDRVHAAGMIHRDIKPANVLCDGDTVLVSDMQMCTLLDDSGSAPRDGSFCTLATEAAPDDGNCSIRTDLYSLAATAYYLFAGKYPVDHHLPLAEQRDMIAAGDIRELRSVAPHVSQAVGTVIRKGLNSNPAKRFESAEAFANALTRASATGRDWKRVAHPGHIYCAEGSPLSGRAAVTICSEAVGSEVELRTRTIETNRRVAGVPDVRVSGSALVRTLQQLVRQLG